MQKYNVKLWNEVALRRKWKWAFRLISMHEDRWAKRMANFNPRHIQQDGQYTISKRSRGRPRRKWEDDLNSFAMAYGYENWMDFAH
eukprot:5078036-Karenia_brevis.AAC.1